MLVGGFGDGNFWIYFLGTAKYTNCTKTEGLWGYGWMRKIEQQRHEGYSGKYSGKYFNKSNRRL